MSLLIADLDQMDAAAGHLLHFPEVLEKLVFPSPAPRNHHGGPKADAHLEAKGFGSVPIDIVETPKQYSFLLDVPGLSKSDIQVTLEDEKVLVIKNGGGKRKREEAEEEEGCRYLRLERRVPARFMRKFRLPEDADAGAVSAKCENGVLEVIVQKLPPPESKTRTVEVTVA